MRTVAIVGAGPAGLFTARNLVEAEGEELRIDLFDRLPTPFGLLRYGVAPDHADIKAVATTLAQVLESPRVRFLGLVEVGRTLSVEELRSGYDAVIYATGAALDRRLDIPGEDLPASRSAREFVSWYSGHPDAAQQSLAGVARVVVVGVGNVALDVARILLKDPAELSATDMPDRVLAELRRARIEHLWVVGRREPQAAAFTTPELRELLALPGLGLVVEGADLAAIQTAGLDRRARANIEALQRRVAEPVADPKRWLHLRFCARPVAVLGRADVTGVRVQNADGSTQDLPAELVVRSIGYYGQRLPGLPFDDGVVPNLGGRVCEPDGSLRPGEYAVGWIKRGPVGLIGANKRDAAETAAAVLADLPSAPRREVADIDVLLAERGIRPSTLADWQAIDAAEIDRGNLRGRERTKIEAWHELLELVTSGAQRRSSPPGVGAGS